MLVFFKFPNWLWTFTGYWQWCLCPSNRPRQHIKLHPTSWLYPFINYLEPNNKSTEWADELHRELKEISSENDISSCFNFDSLLINCVPRTQIDYEHLLAGIRSVKPDYKPNYQVHEDGEKFYRHSIYIRTVRPNTVSF